MHRVWSPVEKILFSPYTAFIAMLVFGALALTGKFSMTGAIALLILAWVIGCTGICRSKIDVKWRFVFCILLGVFLGGIAYWFKPVKQEDAFTVEVRFAFVSDSGPLTFHMVGYPSMFGNTASPVFYLAYLQITNLKDIPTSISDLQIAASKEAEGPWENLVPIPLTSTTLYSLGISNPSSKILKFMRGTSRLATPMTKEDLKYAAIMKPLLILETEIGKPIAPHGTIWGWVALDSLRHYGLSPGQIFFRIKIIDASKKHSVIITELPLRQAGDSSSDVNRGEIQVVGECSDLSGYHVKYYGDPYPRPR